MSHTVSPAASPWLGGFAPAPSQTYPLAIRDHGLGTAFGLLARSLPYALARFALLLGFAIAGIVWLAVTFAGAAWLGTHVARAFGWVWLIVCLVGAGWFWGAVLRYALHLVACGHVAVLTELITRGTIGNGSESMFAYGRRIVTERFGQVTALFALNALVRGVLQSFHRTLDWFGEMLPIPGLGAIASVLTIVLRAATRYLDKVLFSYTLARGESDPWRGAREGVIYYCQNAKPILKTSVWIVIVERVLSFLLWLALLIPAAAITVMMPASVREVGGLITVLIALLLAGTLRAAFVKPLFLIMIMVRFHALIEHQTVNAEWDARPVRPVGEIPRPHLAGIAAGLTGNQPSARRSARSASPPPRTRTSIRSCVSRQTGVACASTIRPDGVSTSSRPRRSAGSTATSTSPARSNGLSAAVNVVRSMANKSATDLIPRRPGPIERHQKRKLAVGQAERPQHVIEPTGQSARRPLDVQAQAMIADIQRGLERDGRLV